MDVWSPKYISMRDSTRRTTTKDAILDATDKLLGKHGYKKMTIDDLARAVGIGKGSVYLHFKSKEDIALSHVDRIIERLKYRLREIGSSKASCENRITRMLVERVLFRVDSVQHYSQSLNELLAHVRAPLLDRRERYFEEEARIFAQVLEEGECSGVFMIGDSVEKARILLLATNSLLPYSLSARELGERKQIEQKIRRLAALLLQGLMKR
jgi:AcrR family transcriptional regulator